MQATRNAVLGRSSRWVLIAVVVAAVALAWIAREAQHRRIELPSSGRWFTTDPDSLYHMRRVERALREGLPVAGTDPFLAWPEGSAIPWPPYYTLLSVALLAPFAPDAGEQGGAVQHEWIERSVATLPFVFGLLGVLVAALAAHVLCGPGGAWIASTYAALCTVVIAYSKPGNGDHHAFVSLCSAVVLLLLARAFDPRRLERRGASLALGACAGLVVGIQMGAWAGAVLYVLAADLALGWLIVLHARRPFAGLPWLGLGFHLAAALALLPAVVASPWKGEQPWMVVNLTWFHLVFLLAGAAVFAPLLALREPSRALRGYPWIVVGALAVAGAILVGTDSGPGRGIREGLEWAARENDFMARVQESKSLLARPGLLFDALGWGVLLFPFAWFAMAWQACVSRRLELLPWVAATALLAPQAALQARFAEPFAIPMAVVLGWGAVQLASAPRWSTALMRVPRALLACLALALVAGANAQSVRRTWRRLRAPPSPLAELDSPTHLAARQMAEWLRSQPADAQDPGVLAVWSWGHLIEWAGERPTVATNFGLYVGEDSFRDPARFFLSEDPAAAEALLERRRCGHVLVTSDFPDHLNSMLLAVDPSLRSRYVEEAIGTGGSLTPEWFRTLGARLMFDGQVFGPAGAGERPLAFLRLVFVSGLRDPERTLRSAQEPSPAGWLWQRVPGARVEARADPGAELEVQIAVEYPRAQHRLVWTDRARADAEGVARLRVPYATAGPNGQGRATSAQWSIGGRSGALEIGERAVLAGEVVALP
jgi:asparagine N-glycosylation enzyme membrane subunit Stt3